MTWIFETAPKLPLQEKTPMPLQCPFPKTSFLLTNGRGCVVTNDKVRSGFCVGELCVLHSLSTDFEHMFATHNMDAVGRSRDTLYLRSLVELQTIKISISKPR